MSTHLDIVGSIILAGMLMLSIARFNTDRQAALMTASNTSTIQMQMESATTLLLFDLRKAGHRVTSGNAFLVCEPRRLVFRGDLENDGRVDTITYIWRGAVAYTPNPRDTLLWRSVNATSAMSSTSTAGSGSDLGICALRFRYYDKNNVETATIANVKTVRISIRVESRFPTQLDDQFQEGFDEVDVNDRTAFQQFTSEIRITPRNVNP